MNIEFTKDAFEKAVLLAHRISGKNVNLPVLSCLIFEAKNKTCFIRATNLDLGIEIRIAARVEEEGVVAVPANLLASFVQSLNGENKIHLSLQETVLRIKTGKSVMDIKTLPSEDFPTLPKAEAKKAFLLPVKTILQGIKSVWYAGSNSTIKPELASVYIHFHDGKLIFVSTDSFRLAEKSIPLQKLSSFDSILIPNKNIPDIIRILESVDGDIEIHITQTQIAFIHESFYLISRLIDAQFPDYVQIIPKQTTTVLTALKADLLHSLKKTIVFSDSFNQIGFVLDPKKKECVLKAANNETGTIDEYLESSLSGEELSINFNYRYLIDCFQSIPTDSVSLSFSGLGRPLVIRGVGDQSFLYLVMPLNR